MWGSILSWAANMTGTVLGYFGAEVAKRTAFYVLASVATVAIFVAFASLCTAAITGFTSGLQDQWLIAGAGLLLPWNTSLCLSAYMSASFAKWMVRIGLIHVLILAKG